MFGSKIKVNFAGASFSPVSIAPVGRGSPSLNGACNTKSMKVRRERTVDSSPHMCSASTSNDSGVKLSSSDDNEGVGEDSGLAVAPAELASRPCDNSQVESTACSVPSNGDDIVVCGPVEEIDVDEEMPTKDVNTHDTVQTSVASDAVKTPSKKTKRKKSQCDNKPCKFIVCSTCMIE